MCKNNINSKNTDSGTVVAECDYECGGCGEQLTLTQVVLNEDCTLSCPGCGNKELRELVDVELVE